MTLYIYLMHGPPTDDRSKNRLTLYMPLFKQDGMAVNDVPPDGFDGWLTNAAFDTALAELPGFVTGRPGPRRCWRKVRHPQLSTIRPAIRRSGNSRIRC